MTNASPILRSLIIYAICLPLALILGYLLASPLEWTSFGTIGLVLFTLILPLLLKFHYPLLLLAWNATMIVFFMPGAPQVWLPMAALSLLVSVVRRTIDPRFRFISVPSLTAPLIALAVVVLVTAEATGGIKMRSMGGETFGGKNYILIIAAVAGYHALTAEKIPRHRASLYVALFLLGGMTTIMGDLISEHLSSLYGLAWFFPPSMYLLISDYQLGGGLTRFAGLNGTCMVLFYWMLAKYGIRGVFSTQKPWRLALLVFFGATSLLGGFRSNLIILMLVFGLQFYLEGLHRTKILPVLLVGLLFTATVSLPVLRKFPESIQRTLAFLPIPIDPMVRLNAEASSEWRLNLWKALLPQVPKYLLLGKGYAFTAQDFDYSVNNLRGTMGAMSEDQGWAGLSANYHSGPLSVTIPFGIWGDITFLWFLAAAIRVLYKNYRYGDPSLRTINTFLLAMFGGKTILFFTVFGSLTGDVQLFIGYLGLGVALNGGVCRPAPEPASETARIRTVAVTPSQLRPAFQRSKSRV